MKQMRRVEMAREFEINVNDDDAIFSERLLYLLLGPCHVGSCYNGGQCVGNYAQLCQCPRGFQGARCQYGQFFLTSNHPLEFRGCSMTAIHKYITPYKAAKTAVY